LLKSLDRRPPRPELLLVRNAEDQAALATLARDPEIARLATSADSVALLWEVCQVPDFRKILSDHHAQLLSQLYLRLMRNDLRLPEDWVGAQLQRLDRVDGDLDHLIQRIAHVRTWTYITHRGDWLADNAHWQARARAIEDALSDALHEQLTQRFVDRRSAVLVRRLRGDGQLLGAVRKNGEVLVEGEFVGRLDGFEFRPDSEVGGDDARQLLTAARRALTGEIPRRIRRLEEDGDGAFALTGDRIAWRGTPVARLAAGDTALTPRIEVLHSDFLDGPSRERLRKRAAAWLGRHIRAQLKPLTAAQEAELTPAGRGVLFQVVEALGTLPRRPLAAQLKALTKADRKTLSQIGLRLGSASLFMPKLQHPRMLDLRARLWAIARGCPLPVLPPPGAKSFDLADHKDVPAVESFCHAVGFRRVTRKDGSALAVRADVLERLSREAFRRATAKPESATPESVTEAATEAVVTDAEAEPPQAAEAAKPQPTQPTATTAKSFSPIVADPAFCALAGCNDSDLEALLFALGYRRHGSSDGQAVFVRKGPRQERSKERGKGRGADAHKARTRQPQQQAAPEAVGAAAIGEPRKPRRARGKGKAHGKSQAEDREKRTREPLDKAAIAARKARQEEARRREEKRMADSPFAILKQLSFGGE
jgi:ATP-dependent RNA helicase SUPV3L1/SUV3